MLTLSFVVLSQPPVMRAELSWLYYALADAPADVELTILADSLCSIQKPESLQSSQLALDSPHKNI